MTQWLVKSNKHKVQCAWQEFDPLGLGVKHFTTTQAAFGVLEDHEKMVMAYIIHCAKLYILKNYHILYNIIIHC